MTLREIESELRRLLPPSNHTSRGTICGVSVQRQAARYLIGKARTPAYCLPDAASLIQIKAAA